MRSVGLMVLAALVGCAHGPVQATAAAGQTSTSPEGAGVRRMSEDTPMATVAGHSFVVPADWAVGVDGRATILEAPEGGSRIALVDVEARNAAEAVDAAWQSSRRVSTSSTSWWGLERASER